MMLCLVLATTTASPAAAAAGSLQLASPAPVGVSGLVSVTLDGGSLVSADGDATGDLVLRGATGRVTVWEWDATRVEAEHPLGILSVQSQVGDADPQVFDVAGADLVLATRHEAATLRVVPQPGASLLVESRVEDHSVPRFLGAPVASSLGMSVTPYRQAEQVAWRWDAGWLFYGQHESVAWPEPWLAMQEPVARLDGAFRIQMHGGNLTFADADGRAHVVRLGAWSATTLGDGERARVETVRWAIFEGTVEPSALPLQGAWGGATPTPEWVLRGTLSFQNATGTVDLDGVRRHVVDEAVDVTGEVVVRPRATSSPGARYVGEGDLQELRVAGRAVANEPPALPAAATASLLAVLAGALGVAWALYTRVRGGKLLDHPMRRAIYDQVVAHPGIYKRELQRAVGCGWGAFQFHFRALERPGYLRTVAQGKYVLVFAGHVKPAQTAAVVPNPLARRIYEAIPEGRGVALHDLRVQMGISYQLLKYHLRGLEARGLVQRVDSTSRAVSIMRRPLPLPQETDAQSPDAV